MILGIGADDVFILYDAWLQSAHVEGVKESIQSRFSWAYRRSTLAMPLGEVGLQKGPEAASTPEVDFRGSKPKSYPQ